MLKKLFVHEWKDTWKVPALLVLVVAGLTFIGAFFLNSKILEKMDKSTFLTTTIVFYVFAYVASIAALSMITGIYFWYRFYRNLFTDQGYLMHTLPVKASELIWSKFFVCAIWQLVSAAVQLLSICTILNSAFGIFKGFKFSDLFAFFKEMPDAEKPQCILMMILMLLLFASLFIMGILMEYAAICIGQIFHKHRIGAAILIYIGLYMAMQSISTYAMIPINMLEFDLNSPTPLLLAATGALVVVVAVTVGLYFICHNSMSNKLNLE